MWHWILLLVLPLDVLCHPATESTSQNNAQQTYLKQESRAHNELIGRHHKALDNYSRVQMLFEPRLMHNRVRFLNTLYTMQRLRNVLRNAVEMLRIAKFEFENKIIHAARTGKRAELIQLQKLFETEILLTVLKSINNSTDAQSIIDNIVIQDERSEPKSKIREKRAIGLLTNLLGSSSGSSSGGGGGGGGADGGDGGGGSGSGSILNLLGPLLGSSSGGGGGEGEGSEEGGGGGGSGSGSILNLLGPLLGSSSGGGGGEGEGSGEGGGGGGILEILTGVLGGSSGGGGGGGSGEEGGGGGGSDLSSILGISSSSSNSGGGAGAGAGAATHKR